MAELRIPELSLVVLIGPSGAGKSTFAHRHFRPTEVVGSDFCRALISDDEDNQEVSPDAFQLLHFIVAKRLKLARLTVVDATNVRPEARRPLLRLARRYHVPAVAVVLDLPLPLCIRRSAARPGRPVEAEVVERQWAHLRRSLPHLREEGFRQVVVWTSPEEAEAAEVVRERMPFNRRDDHGPFDIVGDVHGCFDELTDLLGRLGYRLHPPAGDAPWRAEGPGRRILFLGDLVDRGPDSPGVLRLVMDLVEAGRADCVLGNHDDKLRRALEGRPVSLAHGLAQTLEQLRSTPPGFIERVRAFLASRPHHLILHEGRLVVAHAGLKAGLQGRDSKRVREFALYGETTGERDEFGLPVRLNWAERYRGRALVVYGHTPVPEPLWLNHTVNIDTGCVFGGRLTALRYPEMETVSVPARQVYYEPVRPFPPLPRS